MRTAATDVDLEVVDPGTVRGTTEVLVVDDHPAALHSVAVFLDVAPDIQVTAKTTRPGEAIELARLFSPAVAVVDLDLGDTLSGEEVCHRLLTLPAPPRILIYTGETTEGALWRSMNAGATGFLTKSSPNVVQRLQRAVREVAQGHPVVDRELARVYRRFLQGEGPLSLTAREIEIARAIALGATNEEIAESFTITSETVKSHVRSVLAKLRVPNRTAAAHRVIAAGLIGRSELRTADPLAWGMSGLAASP